MGLSVNHRLVYFDTTDSNKIGTTPRLPADQVLVADAGGLYTATDVEAALAEAMQVAARSGGAPHVEGATGEYWSNPASHTTFATSAGIMYCLRVFVPVTRAVDRIGAHVTVGAAASTISLGIYNDDGTGQAPGTILVDGGTIDGNSATAQEKTISATMTGGRFYWLAALVIGGTPTLRADGTTDNSSTGRHATFAEAVGTTVVQMGRFRAGLVSATMPTPAATTTLLVSLMPTIALRLA